MRWIMKKLTVLCLVSMMMLSTSQTIYATGLDWESLNEQGIHMYGMHEFKEGLMPVLTDDGWNYINESGSIIDLNKGRFLYVYPFFEGFAAVIDFEDKVGYINVNGEIVIPCQFENYHLRGSVYTGYFNNGTAPILKVELSSGFSDGFLSNEDKVFIREIDKKGNVIGEYKEVDLWEGKYNIISDSGHDLGKAVEENKIEYTLNQSILKLTGWREYDNGNGIYYDLKNNEDSIDINNFALILYSNNGGEYGFQSQIHFIKDIELGYREIHQGIFHSQFYAPMVLNDSFGAVIVKFKDSKELEQFKSTVPPNEETNNAYGIDYSIDNGITGKQWFKDNFNINIK